MSKRQSRPAQRSDVFRSLASSAGTVIPTKDSQRDTFSVQEAVIDAVIGRIVRILTLLHPRSSLPLSSPLWKMDNANTDAGGGAQILDMTQWEGIGRPPSLSHHTTPHHTTPHHTTPHHHNHHHHHHHNHHTTHHHQTPPHTPHTHPEQPHLTTGTLGIPTTVVTPTPLLPTGLSDTTDAVSSSGPDTQPIGPGGGDRPNGTNGESHIRGGQKHNSHGPRITQIQAIKVPFERFFSTRAWGRAEEPPAFHVRHRPPRSPTTALDQTKTCFPGTVPRPPQRRRHSPLRAAHHEDRGSREPWKSRRRENDTKH